MRRSYGLIIAALALAAVSLSALAASPGVPLPPGATEVDVWQFNGFFWTNLGNGNSNALARSWNSNPDSSGGMLTNQHHNISFTNHASVAQWLSWEISATRKDWQIRLPGTYASNALNLVVRSNNDVILSFSGFADLEYEADAPLFTPDSIPTYYGFSNLLFPFAGPNGIVWTRADDFNDVTVPIQNGLGLQFGIPFEIWSKLDVTPKHNSSDYENTGTITLSLTNMKHWIDAETGAYAEL